MKERSIVSIGLSLFEYVEPEQIVEKALKRKKLEDGELENEVWKYRVCNYNIFCECDCDYVKEEQALEFLKKHGFDFEVHSKNAIKYKKGNDENVMAKELNKNEISLRNLFVKILSLKKAIVIHNGLLDLIYFYHHFYCELPNDVQTFICDLNELFKGGLYDTKFICELNTDLKVSYLEYLFYYTQRMNILKIAYDDDHLTMTFDQLIKTANENVDDVEKQASSNVKFYDFGNLKTQILKEKPVDLEICKNYRNVGWCKERDNCTKSHNIDFILDSKFDNSKTKSRYKKDLKKMKELNESDENDVEINSNIIRFSEKGGVHSAGFDAFMTSFSFAYFVLEYYEDMPMKMDIAGLKRKLKFVFNRIFLPFTHKHTLHIRNSEFSNNSRNHRIKYDKMFPPPPAGSSLNRQKNRFQNQRSNYNNNNGFNNYNRPNKNRFDISKTVDNEQFKNKEQEQILIDESQVKLDDSQNVSMKESENESFDGVENVLDNKLKDKLEVKPMKEIANEIEIKSEMESINEIESKLEDKLELESKTELDASQKNKLVDVLLVVENKPIEE